MVNGEQQLPDGWALKTVDEIYEVIGGGTPSTSVPEYWNGDIPWITSADIAGLKDIQPRKKITQDAIANSATSCVPAGSLIVVTRVSLGKVALTSYPLCFSQDSQALIAKDGSVLPEYALYYLAQATQIFKYQGRGTTISGVTKKQLKELPFPVPPLPEQERIVAKIEELFTQLEAGTSALEGVQAGLRRYKASVLKAAVNGRLVNGKSGIGKNGLPDGWQWTTVEEIGAQDEQTVLTGPFGSNLGSGDFKEIGVPVLTIGCLTEQGLNLDKAKYISERKAKELKRYQVREGDFLFSRMATVGRAGLVTKQFEGLIFNYHLMRLRLDSDKIDLNYFLSYVRGSSTVTDYVRDVNHGATRDGINTEQLLGLPVALPPLEEQRRIVAEVERRLSVAREVESTIEEAMMRASRLRQAVLRSAFEGRLS